MAFKLAQKPSYTTTVTVETRNDKDGFDVSKFKVKFARVNLDELDKLRETPNKEAMRQVILGWSDLLDENDAEVDFNPENLEALLLIPQALHGLREAFWKSIFNIKEKN